MTIRRVSNIQFRWDIAFWVLQRTLEHDAGSGAPPCNPQCSECSVGDMDSNELITVAPGDSEEKLFRNCGPSGLSDN